MGDFHVNRGPPTVPLTRTSRNMFFFKSRNLGNAGTLYRMLTWFFNQQSSFYIPCCRRRGTNQEPFNKETKFLTEIEIPSWLDWYFQVYFVCWSVLFELLYLLVHSLLKVSDRDCPWSISFHLLVKIGNRQDFFQYCSSCLNMQCLLWHSAVGTYIKLGGQVVMCVCGGGG